MKQCNIIRIHVGAIMLLLVFIGVFIVKYDIKEDQSVINSNVTEEIEFINAKWLMSMGEVEKAIGCKLKDGVPFPPEDEIFELYYRIENREGCKINLWGGYREITYDFYDNKLFRIRIFDFVYDKDQIDSVIVSNLEIAYGKIQRDNLNFYSGIFSNNDVKIEYHQFEYLSNTENRITKRFLLQFSYIPVLREIIETAKQYQENK